MKKLMQALVVFGAAIAVSSGCGNMVADDSKLTRHQRDSVLAKSDIYGAPVVARALAEAESAKARAARDMP